MAYDLYFNCTVPQEALVSVKNLMFARLPIMSLRMVIWCREEAEDGKLMANAAVEAAVFSIVFEHFSAFWSVFRRFLVVLGFVFAVSKRLL